MIEQYIDVFPPPSTLPQLALEYGGLPFNAEPFGNSTSGVYSVATKTSTGEIYYPVAGGTTIRIYNQDRTLNRTITGSLSNAISIRFNVDESLYGVQIFAASGNTIRVYNSSNDTISYNINAASIYSFEFDPNNTNVYSVGNTGSVTEYTSAGATVSTTLVTNMGRARLLKHQPGTNRIWVGGDNGNGLINRLSYFDATTKAITNVTVPNVPVSGKAIGTITGMSFLGSRIFIHHTSARDAAVSPNSKMISEITDTGTVINQWSIIGNQNNNSDGCVYTGYTQDVILYGIIDRLTASVVGMLILP
jgi:hypothetical protein